MFHLFSRKKKKSYLSQTSVINNNFNNLNFNKTIKERMRLKKKISVAQINIHNWVKEFQQNLTFLQKNIFDYQVFLREHDSSYLPHHTPN